MRAMSHALVTCPSAGRPVQLTKWVSVMPSSLARVFICSTNSSVTPGHALRQRHGGVVAAGHAHRLQQIVHGDLLTLRQVDMAAAHRGGVGADRHHIVVVEAASVDGLHGQKQRHHLGDAGRLQLPRAHFGRTAPVPSLSPSAAPPPSVSAALPLRPVPASAPAPAEAPPISPPSASYAVLRSVLFPAYAAVKFSCRRRQNFRLQSRGISAIMSRYPSCRVSTSVVHRLPKPRRRVRFPYPAPKRNLFCLPRRERFFLAFRAKYRANKRKTGFGAVDWLLRNPVFCVQQQKYTEIAVVQIEFLYFASNY